MKVTKRQLRAIIREERARLREDAIDTELKNLKKNVANDLDHIKDLKDDVEDDHEEELRAEKEKRKDETRFAELAGLPLQEQASGMSSGQSRAIGDLAYQFEDEINARMGSEDRNWYKNDDVMLAILEMLDGLKETIQQYGKM